jgi:predicted ATPase
LVRQTLLAGIAAPRRQLLHASVAEAVERLYPGAVNQHAGEIADHLLKAGSFADRQRLVHWLTLAGKGALQGAAFEEARHIFLSALSQGGAEPRERADLLASLAMAEQVLELWESVFANLREALEIYLSLGDSDMAGKIFAELTGAYNRSGRFEDAARTAQRGLASLEADVRADRARLLPSRKPTQTPHVTSRPMRRCGRR